jgi:PA14 domain/Papain family cysteine protease
MSTYQATTEITPQIENTDMRKFIDELKQQTVPVTLGGIRWEASLADVDTDDLLKRLADRGIISYLVLAERLLAGLNIESEARSLNITPAQTYVLHAAAVQRLTPDEREFIEADQRQPKGKGLLPPDHPTIAPILRGIDIEKRLVNRDIVQRWIDLDRSWVFLPRGPLRAVDHRPKLGPARNQGGRPTCTSFGSTVVAEALEYLRDRRPGPRDFSEEFLWWYSKNGTLITAGGYDCRAALYHYEKNGVPDESLLPYSGQQINSNHAHVPVPDDAIDRAFDHRQPPLAMLPERDVAIVKAVLESGRCVGIGSDTYDWNTATGIISFPDPLDSRGVGGGHCTTIIGYIDRDDLPAHYEGGYFILRNSWGGAGSTTHLMGPEYGGHLLMPYGWYRRYTGWPATLGSNADATETAAARHWRAEYYTNRSLHGTPSRIELIPDVNFNWGSGGPFDVTIPFPFGDIHIPVPPFDEFSARFTQVRRLRSGWYRFTLRGDDGVRLWVDDRLVINHWKEQSNTTYSAEHYVTGGDHVLRVEYFEAHGLANVQLQIQAIEFQYELFANTELTGTPVATFNDSMTDLEWRHAPPVSTLFSHGRFSLRGTARKRFTAGTYTFHSQHTGGCRIWVAGNLVLDDWTGTNGDGAPVAISAGVHEVRVEFAHRTTIPAPDSKSYYRAALAFDWADAAWFGRVHFDTARKVISDAHWPNIDSIYEGYRVQALTGDPVVQHNFAVPQPAGTGYGAMDGSNVSLSFPSNASFGQGIPGGGGIDENTAFFSAIFVRRLHLPVAGRYAVSLASDEAFRVCIDGNKVLERRYGGGDPFSSEIYLRRGVHDVSIEYADAGWGSVLNFLLQPANWSVNYYSGRDLATFHSSKQVMGAELIVAERPITLSASNWSARATRTFWLPVGRYRVAVRADDGVRVKAKGDLIINEWKTQSPTTYTAFLEHSGGSIDFELEYFQGWGGSELSFELTPDGFMGEYYKGIQLDVPANAGLSGWSRNPPHAYRFEEAVDFDWGGTGRLARVGSDRFSARWWGSVEMPVGRWIFRVRSDDGVRLFLDDRLLIDRWASPPSGTLEAIVDLAAARREVRVEYYERTGNAMCKLELEREF